MTFFQLLTAARIALRDEAGSRDDHHSLREATALLFFNEAIHEACRRSRLIVDRSTPAVCSYTVTSNQPVITVDPRIIKIRRAALTSRTEQLRRLYVADMDAHSAGWETHTGPSSGYVADYETNKVFLYPVTPTADTLKLAVVRLPLEDLAGLASVPEIAPQYHAALVEYVVYKVRSIEDTEMYDPRKAGIAYAAFEKEFGPKRSARDEVWENSQPFQEYE
jgi:hypothetical protein